MWKNISLKKWLVHLLVLFVCLISVVGCNSNTEASDSGSESKGQTQAETSENESTESSNSYDNIDKITEGELYDAVNKIAEIELIAEMEVDGDIILHINIKSDSAEAFIEEAENISKLSEIRTYPDINISTNLNDEPAEIAMIVLLWNEAEAGYISECSDLTTDKNVEVFYSQSEFFSAIDMTNKFNEDMEELIEEYEVTK